MFYMDATGFYMAYDSYLKQFHERLAHDSIEILHPINL